MPVNMLHFNPEPARAAVDDHQFSPRDMLNLMRDHVWDILAITVVAVVLALVYVLLATPLYSADVLVRVDAPAPNALGIVAQNQEAPQPGAVTAGNTELEVMQSRSVFEPVVQRYNFDITVTPRTFPFLGALASKFATEGQPSRPWFGLDSFAWGGEDVQVAALQVPRALEEESLKLIPLADDRYELLGPSGKLLLTGEVGQPAAADGISMMVTRLVARPGTEFSVVRWNPLDAVIRLQRDVKVTSKGKDTGVVQLSYIDRDPSKAADVANALAQQYIASAVVNRQRDDSKTLDFINQELPRVRADLARAEEALTAYQLSSQSIAPTTEAQTYLQGGIAFQQQIATLQNQRTQLLQKYTPDSSWVRNIDTQLQQLNAHKADFNARFADMPASERKSADLRRDKEVAQSVYMEMVNKAEQLQVRRASTTGGAHIVDDALRPHRPVKPNRLLVVSAATGLGLFLGAFFVFIRRHVMAGVTDPLFVEHRLSVPVFGEVLFSQPQAKLEQEIALELRKVRSRKGSALVAVQAASQAPSGNTAGIPQLAGSRTRVLADRYRHDVSVEALRAVRTALNRDIVHAPNNVVMFTGPTPFAGKSFVAANMAVLQAEIGSRVLLIDADMRRGHLASYFNQSNGGGLSEVLAGQVQPAEVIRQAGVDGLSFMSCGNYPLNPAELLMKRHFKELLNHLGEQFDLVIVDTPPFLAVTDAAIIASEAGATVLVLRSGMQSEAEITETVKKLQRADARLFGAVFNAIPRRASNRNYGYATAYTSNFEHEGVR
jgi:tyrosine-protein kinase Etk/Wzc